MAGSGKLKLNFVDVRGRRLRERVDVTLYPQGPGSTLRLRDLDAGKIVVVRGLNGPPMGRYRIFVDPPSYLPVQRFVTATSDGAEAVDLVFPVDPAKVVAVKFPPFRNLGPAVRALLERSDQVRGQAGLTGQALYENLNDIRRAGLLNIMAKSSVTPLEKEKNVLDRFEAVLNIEGDRCLIQVDPETEPLVRLGVAGGSFDEVSGAKHPAPDGFTRTGSYKTPDHYGNLQLTFFTKGSVWLADVDIDDANGFAHIFQVARNTLKDRPTHPYDIQQILISHQQVDPQFDLVVRA